MIHKIILFLISIVILMCSFEMMSDESTQHISIDKDTPIIICRSPRNQIASFAASELQHYIKKIIKDSNPQIVDFGKSENQNKDTLTFIIGHNPLNPTSNLKESLKKLKPESFIIQKTGRTIVLVGNDGPGKPTDYRTETGTLFAVYTFLEKYFGIKWIFPGDSGEIADEKTRIQLPEHIDIKEEPSFAVRNFKYTFYKLIPMKTRNEFELWKKRNKMGYVPNIAFGHSYNGHMKGNSYFEAHPEYYALVAGKRRPMRKKALGAQVCTSNPDVVNIFVESVLKKSDRNRNLTSLSPNDGQGFCECENCRALDVPGTGEKQKYSDRIFTFVNEIAKRVKEKRPDKLLGHFGYTFFREPPVKLKKVEDNVVLGLTIFSYEYREPEAKRKEFELIKNWSKIVSKMLAREYHGTYMWYSLPNIQHEYIAQQIPYLKENGFIGIHSEAAPDWSTHGMDYYVLAKLLWDSSKDKNKILDDYYAAAYGPVAHHIRKCHTRIEETLKNNWHKKKGAGWRETLRAIPDLFPVKVLQECRKDVEKAYQSTNDDSIKKRVKHVENGMKYSELTSRYFTLLKEINRLGICMIGFDSNDRLPPEEITKSENLRKLRSLIPQAIEAGEKRMALVEKLLPEHGVNAESFAENRRRWLKTLKSEKRIFDLAEDKRIFLPIKWKFKIDPDDHGEANGYQNVDFNDSNWNSIRTNAVWEEQGYGQKEFPENGNEGYNGIAWYRCKINIPENLKSKRTILLIRALDQKGWIYVNGQLVGEPVGGVYVRINITKYLKFGQENTLAIKVVDERKHGGFCSPAIIEF